MNDHITYLTKQINRAAELIEQFGMHNDNPTWLLQRIYKILRGYNAEQLKMRLEDLKWGLRNSTDKG